MLAVVTDPGLALPTLGFSIVVYLALAIYFSFRRAQPLELRVLVVGLLTGVLAFWCGQFWAADRGSVQVPGPQGGVFFGANEAAGVLGRIAVLLILGGLGMAILGRCGYPVPAQRQEETRRDNAV
jgi:hypothetical protein